MGGIKELKNGRDGGNRTKKETGKGGVELGMECALAPMFCQAGAHAQVAGGQGRPVAGNLTLSIWQRWTVAGEEKQLISRMMAEPDVSAPQVQKRVNPFQSAVCWILSFSALSRMRFRIAPTLLSFEVVTVLHVS